MKVCVSSVFENVRETEEKKQLLKRKREQGKRWFTKPERLDRRNENGAKLQQDPRFFSPLEHTGVSSEVRHFSLELGFPVFWPPQNVHSAGADGIPGAQAAWIQELTHGRDRPVGLKQTQAFFACRVPETLT